MNIANKITLFRIVLIPFVMLFLLLDVPYGRFVAAAIFVVASVSDWLDGHIARKYNMVTNFGKIIDPLADKLLVVAAMLCFVEQGLCPAWCAMILLAREFLVTSLRVVAAGEGKIIAASMWGKVKTTVQLVALLVAMLFGGISPLTAQIAIYIATAFTLVSGVAYIVENKEIFK